MITRATGFALIGAIFFTAQAHTVQAAVPPLSFEELQQNAQYIFTGKVVDIKEEIRETQALGQSVRDSFYFIKVQVQSAQKGPFEVGQVVTFTAWRPKSRPDGFAGHQGQNFIPAQGDAIRAYCKLNFGTPMSALEPNGIYKVGGKNKGKGKR